MTEFVQVFEQALWFVLPAYLANATPVVVGGNRPIDMKKKLSDGSRVLGDGKTFRGFFSGLVAGTLIGLLQATFWGRPGGTSASFLLAFGALVGDILGSFLKRRSGLRRGSPAPLLDQLEFLVVALVFASVIVIPSWEVIITLLILTPIIHLGTNFVGYKVGLKSEPY